MSGWLLPLGLAALVAVALLRFVPREGREAVGAALCLGIAGYAWQGSPGLPGRPTPPPVATAQPDGLFAQTRGTMTEKLGGDAQVLDTAAAFHRQGLDAYAIGILKGALAKRPRSADLWVGLGNALVEHNQGTISPAADFAFDRAAALDPKHPGPAFFRGVALIQSGRPEAAAEVWRALVARAPADAPWRAEVAGRLALLDAAVAERGGAAPAPVERQATDAAAGSDEVGGTDRLR